MVASPERHTQMHVHQTVSMKPELHGHLTHKWWLCNLIFGRHVLLIADQNAADELLPWQNTSQFAQVRCLASRLHAQNQLSGAGPCMQAIYCFLVLLHKSKM